MSSWNWNKGLYAFHGWLGLNFGLLLWIVCLSGTFAVVSHEIDWLLNPDLRVAPQASRATYGQMYRAVQQQYPETPISVAWAPVGPRFACEFWLRDPHGTRRVYVDPYTARVQGDAPWFNTQRFFRDFHRRFFWHAWWGIWLVAAFGFVLLVSSATGLAFYKRWWAKLWNLRWGKAGRLFWSDLHRLCGLWTLLFATLIALTGIWYFAEIPLRWIVQTPPPAKPAEPTLGSRPPGAEPLELDDWVRIAKQTIPELKVGAIFLPAETDSPVRIDGQAAAWLVRDRANTVRIDPVSGQVLMHQRAEQLDPLRRWEDTVDPLHFGNFAGLPSKLVWFVFGLALCVLMPTGAYLWFRRAQQMALSTDRRLRRVAQGLTPQEHAKLVHWSTGRQTGVGIVTTTAILLLAAYATYSALAQQAAEAGSHRTALWYLGGAGPIGVYTAFIIVVLVATGLWYRYVWFGKHRG